MAATDRVDDLLSELLALRGSGRAVTPEDICVNDPELVGELNRRLHAVDRLGRLDPDTRDLSQAPGDDTNATRPRHPQPPAAAMPADPSPTTLGRYRVLAELGQGGMGVVYKAVEPESGRVVAAKTMKLAGGRALELFKGEFRYLLGVSHPNLVQLYALEVDAGRWLLTMEFVDGVGFREYLAAGTIGAADTARPTDTPAGAAGTAVGGDSGGPAAGDVGRVRAAFGQLAEGVAALHAHQRVHRDLKPQNVRVGHDGRVVVLDFGLTAALDHAGEYLASAMMGTVAYMAPEQAGSPPVATPASDWYAFGVMLYEALAGERPFSGRTLPEVIARKRSHVPARPRDLRPGVPADLDELCVRLIRPRPEDRPTGAEVLAAFGREAAPAGRPPASRLFGRLRELSELEEAYAGAGPGGAAVVTVSGPSGIGKSSLVGRFLDGCRAGGAVVLAGRCYEHESVPYKAVDPLVDELARLLHALPDDRAAALMPAAVGPLVQAFPVLERVAAVARAAAGVTPLADPQEVRRQAFAGLREVLARLARSTRLVLHVDDLQWGDVDSAYLLADLISPPDPPAVVWVLSHRSEDAAAPCLTTLREALGRAGVTPRAVEVAPLTEAQVRELVTEQFGPGAGVRAAAVARESRGNPYFVTELLQADGANSSAEGATLDGLIRARVGRLSADARRLLEVVAVSGRPVRDADAYLATGDAGDVRTQMARLEAARLLRGVGSADELKLETYHDRVREAVVAGLAEAERRTHHGRLAEVLESSGRGELEELAQHFEGAGADAKAGGYFRRAGDRAAAAVAFDQAAGFYRKAVELLHPEGDAPHDLRSKLADALANAGRGTEAAPEFLAAAEGATGLESLELQRRAMEQYLTAGLTDQGREVAARLFGRFGQKLPGGPRRAMLAMVWEVLRFRLRGIRFRERPADAIPPEELWRIDVLQTAAHQLVMLDSATATGLFFRAARWALDLGEPSRVARMLAVAAAFTALGGRTSRARSMAILQTASGIIRRLDDPYTRVYAAHNSAGNFWCFGEWELALGELSGCEELAANLRVPFAEYDTNHQHFLLDCQMMTGRWRSYATGVARYLEAARRRGDRFALAAMSMHSYLPELMADNPSGVEAWARQSWEAWPQKGNVMGVYWALYARVEAALYCGDGEAALRLLRAEEGQVKASTHFNMMQVLALLMAHLHGRAELVTAERVPKRSPLDPRLRAAARHARRIERANTPWSNPLAGLLRAGAANLHNQSHEAVRLLGDAAGGFDAAGMRMYAAAARWQRGRLLGGDEGRELVRAADAFMIAEGVRQPDRIAHMLVPGFPA